MFTNLQVVGAMAVMVAQAAGAVAQRCFTQAALAALARAAAARLPALAVLVDLVGVAVLPGRGTPAATAGWAAGAAARVVAHPARAAQRAYSFITDRTTP